MKNVFIILMISLSGMIANAQSPVLPLRSHGDYITNGCYLKDSQNELLPFTGTWVYQNGNTKVTLKFQRVKLHLDMSYPSYYKDILEAKYKVEVNNMVIFDNLNEAYNIVGTSMISGGIFQGDKYLVTFVDDLKCEIWGEAKIWIENGKLHWDMMPTLLSIDPEYDCPQSNDDHFYDNMTLPWNMVLTKQGFGGL
ncbi:DUF6705 family protein [Moheibacter sediminis]|uniref:DUF6705 domain-containing protein n=1 Tax=Moheibacter sediminis TaxID=1434700 RepID=A0A1W2C0Y9_9FLAO|nr:DUF6705 family protein [Moheibacter sediminis]SMC78849.1 hypothetical protein SAMN06296427_10848 [Moheibacter sediminis]